MIVPLDSFAARYLLYTGVHFVADFSQSAWMAEFKIRPNPEEEPRFVPWWEVLIYHVAMYTGFYVVVAYFVAALTGNDFNLLGPLWVAVTHGIVDVLKSIGVIKKIWVDQALHLLSNIPPVYFDWL